MNSENVPSRAERPSTCCSGSKSSSSMSPTGVSSGAGAGCRQLRPIDDAGRSQRDSNQVSGHVDRILLSAGDRFVAPALSCCKTFSRYESCSRKNWASMPQNDGHLPNSQRPPCHGDMLVTFPPTSHGFAVAKGVSPL